MMSDWMKTASEVEAEKKQVRLERMRASRKACRLALHRAGLLDDVEALADNDREFRIWYEDSGTWRRISDYLVTTWTDTLGRSIDELESLFDEAMQIDGDS